jgi:hypothetical protein
MRVVAWGLFSATLAISTAGAAQDVTPQMFEVCNAKWKQHRTASGAAVESSMDTSAFFQNCYSDNFGIAKPAVERVVIKEETVSEPARGTTADFGACRRGYLDQSLSEELARGRCLKKFEGLVPVKLTTSGAYDFMGAFEFHLRNDSQDVVITHYAVKILFPNQPDKYEFQEADSWIEPNTTNAMAFPIGGRWQKFIRSSQPPNNPYVATVVNIRGLRIAP